MDNIRPNAIIAQNCWEENPRMEQHIYGGINKFAFSKDCHEREHRANISKA